MLRPFLRTALTKAKYEEVNLDPQIARALWRYAGNRDFESIHSVLVYDAGIDWLEDEEIVDFVLLAEPDDIIGESYEAWVKTR